MYLGSHRTSIIENRGGINKHDGRPTGRPTILQWTNNMGGWSVSWSDSPSCLLKQARIRPEEPEERCVSAIYTKVKYTQYKVNYPYTVILQVFMYVTYLNV